MVLRVVLLLSVLGWCGCERTGGGHVQAIVGAVLIDGNGGPPLADSVVVVSDGQIVAAGRRSNVPIPAEADRIDGSGKYLVPVPLNMLDHSRAIQPHKDAEARAEVSRAASQIGTVIVLEPVPAEVADTVMDEARSAGIPVYPRIETQAEVRRLMDSGASGFIGMIRDTETLEPALLTKMRDLRLRIAPDLSSAGSGLAAAQQNTLRMFKAGVPLAIACTGDPQPEMELIAGAGVPPLDVLVAATRNTAAAIRSREAGVIDEGKRADMLLLSANPGEDIRNMRQVAMRIARAK